MKIGLLIIFLGFAPLTSYSQTSNDKEIKNNHYKWGVSFVMNSVYSQLGYINETGLTSGIWGSNYNYGKRKDNSLSLSLIPTFNVNENFSIRMEFGWTKIDINNNLTAKPPTINLNNQNYGVGNDQINQRIFRYVPGVQFFLLKRKWIESYCGIILPFIAYSNIERKLETEQRNIDTDTLVSWNNEHVKIPGGKSFGIGTIGGFSIYLTKHLSIGAEFSCSFLYSKIGGEVNYETSGQSFPNPPYIESKTFLDSFEGIKFSKIQSSLNISYVLNISKKQIK
jgi:hypothetical protein